MFETYTPPPFHWKRGKIGHLQGFHEGKHAAITQPQSTKILYSSPLVLGLWTGLCLYGPQKIPKPPVGYCGPGVYWMMRNLHDNEAVPQCYSDLNSVTFTTNTTNIKSDSGIIS